MLETTRLSRFWKSQRGAVSIEFGLLLPMVLLIVWAFWTLGESYRMQSELNRQTALLAEMLANQPESYTLEGSETPVSIDLALQLPTLAASANDILKDALGKDNNDIQTGVIIEYLPAVAAGEELVAGNYAAGRQCERLPGTPSLISLSGAGGGMLTPGAENGAGAMRLLRVQTCVVRRNIPEFMELVAPKTYLSQFVTTRKEN